MPADKRGPLHGLPIAIKEEYDIRGVITSYGGQANTTPAAADCEVVARLRAAGAIFVATTRMPEFGAWPQTESLAGGITRNPWDLDHTPGGSSGGTAALVAAGTVPLAMGSDGGGSIRIPSAFCGLVGLKGTRGLVSTAPYPDLWGTLGVDGPLARSVDDLELIFSVITDTPVEIIDVPSLRIAATTRRTSPLVRVHRENRGAVALATRKARALGHSVRELESRLPDPTASFLPQFLASLADESARVDVPERCEPRIRRLARAGKVMPKGVLHAAVSRGERLRDQIDSLFDGADLILTPTCAGRPNRAGTFINRGALCSMIGSTPAIAFTALFNVTGHPAIAVPMGTGTDGLPRSAQLVGPYGSEGLLLSVARQLMEEGSASR